MDEKDENPELAKKTQTSEDEIHAEDEIELDIDEENSDDSIADTEEENEPPEHTPDHTDPPEASMNGFPLKKIISIIVVVLILLAVGLYAKHSYHIANLRSQMASQILAQAASMQDIQNNIGTGVTVGKSVKGTVNEQDQSAQLVFAVQGSKGTGTLVATMSNGRLSALSLGTANGHEYNVLEDQSAYESAQAAKAALASKQQATEQNFNNAVTAIKNRDYQAAITGFSTSIQNTYQVTESYQYLGFAYSQSNQYPLCVSAYGEYMKLKSDDSEAYYQLAYCYLQMYQTSEALVALDKSCQLGYQAACDAATQIKGQLNQKPVTGGYAPLSPQQTIQQQQVLQTQLQSSGQTQQQDLLNNETGPGGAANPSTVVPAATGSAPASTQPAATGSAPAAQGSMPAQSAVQGSMPAQSAVEGSMPAQSAIQGSMAAQSAVEGSMPAQSAVESSMPAQPAIQGSMAAAQSAVTGSAPAQ